MHRQPAAEAWSQVAAVDGGQRVADGRAHPGDGADPGRGRQRLVQLRVQQLARECEATAAEVVAELEGERALGVDHVRSPGWVTATRPSWWSAHEPRSCRLA